MTAKKPSKGTRPSKDARKAKAKAKAKHIEGKKEEPKPHGRPSKYTEALATDICDRLSNGETLTSICRDEHMPERRTVLRWKVDVDGFSSRYVRAREEQRELWQDEIVDISEDGRNDWMEKQIGRDETILVVNKEVVDRSKLRVDSRKWLLTKLDRPTFGEKVEQTHKGGEAFLSLFQMMTAGPPSKK